MAFGADLTTGGEGIFLARKGQISQIVRSGDPAPGGGTFGRGFLATIPLNDRGDAAFSYLLEPFTSPFGVNGGTYHFSRATGIVTPVAVPDVTPAPGGGTFKGAAFRPSINNRGDITFAGIVSGADIAPGPPGVDGLGVGIFRATKDGQIFNVVRPGDPAPGGGTFDFAENPWINDLGDVAFGAHVGGEECIDFGVSQADLIFCAESVYVKKAATGEIQSIAHQGDAAPGGGVFRFAFGPVLNNRGEIAFIGDLTLSPDFNQDLGVFLHSRGITIPVARPGDPMPGGGNLVRASGLLSTYDLNDRGDVSFTGTLDTDVNSDGKLDTGVFVWSRGSLSPVARTGTVIPGLGTIVAIQPPDLVAVDFPFAWVGAASNERGQIVFTAAVDDSSGTLQGVLLVATPK